jgi:iron complex outermembrane receptor protein
MSALAMGLLSFCPVSAVVQAETATVDTGQAAPVRLEEVVVTARKRIESLQDVPASITAFTEATLERINAESIDDILLRTPNLYEAYLGESKGSPPSIRGVSGTNTAGADPAVAFVVDDVYYGNNTEGVFDLSDLQSLEVLRGPQGTLFGRNTTGGVINVRTRDPSDTPDGEITASYGNYGHIRTEGSVTGPLIPSTLDGSISGVFNDRDGFIKNTYPGGSDLRSEHNWFIRSALRYTPGESTQIFLRMDYRDLDQRGGGYKADGLNPNFTGAIPGLGFVASAPFAYSVTQDQSGIERLKAWGASLTAVQQLPGSELRSITAYRTHDYYSIFDTDLSPNKWVNDGSPEQFHQLSQEFRWSSTGTTGNVWILGLYYYHGNSLDNNFITFQQDLLPVLGFPPGTPNQTAEAYGNQITNSYAAYGHYELAFTSKLGLAIGTRYTHDHKSINYAQTDQSGFFGGPFTENESKSWSAFTGDAALSYKWTPDLLTYVSVARGFKAGGFNDGLSQQDNPPFGPEYVTSYEAGVKSSWLQRRLTVDAATYYYKWSDIQVAGFDYAQNQFSRVTGNFGLAYSQGGELALTARPLPALELSLAGGWQRGHLVGSASHGITATDTLTGPDYSANAGIQFTQPLDGHGSLVWYADALLQGRNDLTQGTPTPGQIVGPHQGGFVLYNARIQYLSRDERWGVALWGKNLANKVYITKYFDLGGNPLLPPGAFVLSDPRTYGLELHLKLF